MSESLNILREVGQVFLVAAVFGVSLPALFALGIRAMAYGVGGDAEVDHAKPHPVGRILGMVCFGLVALAIIGGIYVIVVSGLGLH